MFVNLESVFMKHCHWQRIEMSESYVLISAFSGEKKISSNFTVFWNNRRLIGSCLYSLVLARGLLLKRFPPLILTCQHKGLLQVRQGSQGCLHKRPNILLLSNLSHYSSFDFEPECHLSWSCCCCLRIRQMWTDGRQRTRGDNAIWVLNSCQMKACTTKVLS